MNLLLEIEIKFKPVLITTKQAKSN